MSPELWEYASKLSEYGDPDSQAVRGIAQQFENNLEFQDVVGRLNNLHDSQHERAKVNANKKLIRKKKRA